jgi:CRISPR/Cas system CSM-associated protein Csm2 small subunit
MENGRIGISLSAELSPSDVGRIKTQIQQLQQFANTKGKINLFGGTNNTDTKKIFDSYGNILSDLTKKTKNYGDTANKNVKPISNYFKSAADEVDKLSHSTGNALTKFTEWYVVSGIVTSFFRIIKDGIQTVIALDKTLVDLQMATGYTRAETANLLVDYNKLGKE